MKTDSVLICDFDGNVHVKVVGSWAGFTTGTRRQHLRHLTIVLQLQTLAHKDYISFVCVRALVCAIPQHKDYILCMYCSRINLQYFIRLDLKYCIRLVTGDLSSC